MRVTVTDGCPGTDAGTVGVRNTARDLDAMLLPATAPTGGLICEYAGANGKRVASTPLDASAAAQLAAAVASSSLSHLDNVRVHCPMNDGSITVLVFTYPNRADVDLWYALTGCQSLSNGYVSVAPSDALNELVNPAASGPPFPPAAASS